VKQEDRDMLIRINERTHNIWRAVEQMEQHQREQNDSIRKLFNRTGTNTVWRRVIVGVGGTALLVIIAWITNLNGLWVL